MRFPINWMTTLLYMVKSSLFYSSIGKLIRLTKVSLFFIVTEQDFNKYTSKGAITSNGKGFEIFTFLLEINKRLIASI